MLSELTEQKVTQLFAIAILMHVFCAHRLRRRIIKDGYCFWDLGPAIRKLKAI